MKIINIWTVFDNLQKQLSENTVLDNLFVWWIYSGKPIHTVNWLALYFGLTTNNTYIETDRNWQRILMKKAIMEFVVVWNKKNIPDVEMFEAFDVLVNEIVDKQFILANKDLELVEVLNISELNQTWVVYDTNENPIIVWQFEFIYKNY